MISRRQFQTADGNSTSAVYTSKPYPVRFCAQTADVQKKYLKFSPSGNCKTALSHNWSMFAPDG